VTVSTELVAQNQNARVGQHRPDETHHLRVGALYPQGMHATIAAAMAEDAELRTCTATLQEPEHGLTEASLAETDVLSWWGHAAHDKVDAIVDRVLEGMGLIVLHSGHYSKIFKRRLGTTCSLRPKSRCSSRGSRAAKRALGRAGSRPVDRRVPQRAGRAGARKNHPEGWHDSRAR